MLVGWLGGFHCHTRVLYVLYELTEKIDISLSEFEWEGVTNLSSAIHACSR